ncbi:MAG: hypothetical protein VKK62_01585 [Synechococcaceae cyanobacterium]|nr:hypothetical protein [Synechococcaceae cyanobacterium]
MQRRLLPLVGLLALSGSQVDGLVGLLGGRAEAQANPRATFPGRRVGGGTRGECNSRLIVHLVPASSVFAPAASPLLGVLLGPAPEPHPLMVSFRPQGTSSSRTRRQLPAAPAGVLLLSLPPLDGPTVWESTYRCAEAPPADADPLQVVSASSPPALSLLVKQPTPQDAPILQGLQSLRKHCGGTVSRAEVGSAFGLTELLKDGWPDQLPVSCPS